MQIKRLLNDIEVVAGDKLINSQGEHCEFVEHAYINRIKTINFLNVPIF